MSILRKIMRNMVRNGTKRQSLGGNAAVIGNRRAGMHQAAEHDFRRSRMADGAGVNPPTEETPEEALDIPAEIEAEIPPIEEDDDEEVAAIAEGETGVEAEAEIVEEIADPDMALNEELEGEPDEEAQMSVDYSGERIPEIDPTTGGTGVDADTPLEYSSGDGSLKEIQEPLPGMGEKYGVQPKILNAPEIIHGGAPEVEFTLDGEGNLVVSAD